MLKIEEIENNESFKEFIKFPYVLYKNEPNWIPPLKISQSALFDLKKNPFWKTCDHTFFIATKNGTVCGRISAILHYEYFNSIPTGFFGFLEAIDDKDVFQKLLETVERWLKLKGCEKIVGPVNPSINYEMGTLISGFELPPYIMMTYNFEYCPKHIEAAGYAKEMDFLAYYTGKGAPTFSIKLDRIIELTKKKYSINVRRVRKKDFHAELLTLHALYNDAFQEHYGFVPMTLDEFTYMGKDLVQIVDEDFLLIAEYKNEPIAFLLALPNYNEVFDHLRNGKLLPFGWLKFLFYRNKISSIRIMTIAVKHQFKHMGIGAYLYREIIRKTIEKNTQHVEMSWVAENNIQMNKAVIKSGAVPNKKYRLYQKNI